MYLAPDLLWQQLLRSLRLSASKGELTAVHLRDHHVVTKSTKTQ